MSEYIVKINKIESVTHNVNRYETEKPKNLDFKPGQATEVAINRQGWKKEGRPFTFTSLPKQEYLEFTIKSYPEHEGVTDKLLDLEEGDEFILNDVFGAINYQGKGVFIAGGAGVTPFISIFRKLEHEDKVGDNTLIFANKTEKDIIYKEELENRFGKNFINILSQQKDSPYAFGHIDKEFLKENVKDFDQKFYVCGPPPMIESVVEDLKDLGVQEDDIIIEES